MKSNEEWSSQLWSQFLQLRKEAWKKFRTSTGLEPVTSRYRCDALPTELWSHWRWEQVNFGFICSRERYVGEWCIWNKSYGEMGKWGRSPWTELNCMLRHMKTMKVFKRIARNSDTAGIPCVIDVRPVQTLLSFYITVLKFLDNKKKKKNFWAFFQSFWHCTCNRELKQWRQRRQQNVIFFV